MNLQENIQRIKEVMGINESEIPLSIRRRASKEEIERYIKDSEFDLQFYCDHYVDAEDYAYDVIDTAVDNFLSQIEEGIEEMDYYSDVLDYLRNLCRNSFGEYLIDAYKTNCKGKSNLLRGRQEQTESEITERCWKGYTQKGMKTMFGKKYPNCIKKKKK
jgi:hypothetical protein